MTPPKLLPTARSTFPSPLKSPSAAAVAELGPKVMIGAWKVPSPLLRNTACAFPDATTSSLPSPLISAAMTWLGVNPSWSVVAVFTAACAGRAAPPASTRPISTEPIPMSTRPVIHLRPRLATPGQVMARCTVQAYARFITR